MEITIRTADPSDAEAMLKCYTAPLAARNTLQIPYRSLESVREQLTKSGAGDHLLVAEIEGEVVGKGVGAALMRAVIELADKWLNLTRIELSVFTDNESAIALYRKFGFEIEGTLRKYAFRDGEFVDAFAMARIK